MKMMILFYLLLCVTFDAASMQQNEIKQLDLVTFYKQSVTNLSPLNIEPEETHQEIITNLRASIFAPPNDVKWLYIEEVANDETIEKSVSNVHALRDTCKYFRKLMLNEAFNIRIIKKWTEKFSCNNNVPEYWHLFTIVRMLKTKKALEWFFKKYPKDRPINIRTATCEQRDQMQNALAAMYGGLSIGELRLLDIRPLKVLEGQEPYIYGQQPQKIRFLSLKSYRLRNLEGVEFIQDLSTVELLDLSGNNLKALEHKDLCKMTNLTKLDLAFNDLKVINLGIFAKLLRLQVLDLHSNKLETVCCEEPLQSTNLQSICLNSNNLKYFDTTIISKLPARVLDLRGNPLQNWQEIRALSKPVNNRILIDGD